MKIETKLEFNEYLKLMYVLTYRKPITIFLSIIGLIMFIGSILYFIGMNIPVDEPPYFQLIFGFFMIVILPISIMKSSKKNFSSLGILQEKIVYEFTDEKINITGETFSSERDWTKTYKVIELKNWILIYQNRQVVNILPKESFGENINEFRNIVRNKNIKSKLKRNN